MQIQNSLTCLLQQTSFFSRSLRVRNRFKKMDLKTLKCQKQLGTKQTLKFSDASETGK